MYCRAPAALRRAAALACSLVSLAGLSCGAPIEVTEPEEIVVTMYDNSFSPPVVRLPVGEEVLFVNRGRNLHNAMASDGTWSTLDDFGTLEMKKGDSAKIRFAKAGVFPYFCTYHGTATGQGMVGTAVVGDVDFDAEAAGYVPAVAEASGAMLRVPSEYPTIQNAVDGASPGDLILISAGVHREEVVVTTPSLVIRGMDRNRTIIDGEFMRSNGFLILADGVAIENLTVRNALLNGVFWSGITGYRASYVTAHNNGDYGIYAFDSTDGLLEHSYASGSPDSGFYIGQCYPCRAVIRNVVSERNGLGYSGTNSGGDLYIVSSIWRDNMAGLAPNTLDSELLPPERETHIVANLVVGNHNLEAPITPFIYPVVGNGILISGGLRNVIERNWIVNHALHGIYISPMVHDNVWPARDNIVRHNVIRSSGRADLAVASPLTSGNCFEENVFEASSPPGLEVMQRCSGPRAPIGFDLTAPGIALAHVSQANGGEFPHGDWRTLAPPDPQPHMPRGAAAPVVPAVNVFEGLQFDVATARLPREAARYGTAQLASAPSGSWLRYTAWLPLAIWLLWMALALADLIGRRSPGSSRYGWIVACLVVPYLGAGLYLCGAARTPSRAARLGAVGGALLVYALGVAAGILAGRL